jgi:histidyl-tRNA synthetase
MFSRINVKYAGWIEKLYVNETGQQVGAGDPMLDIYSPELVAAQEEYLLAFQNLKNLEGSEFETIAKGAASLLDASRRRLLYWDVTEAQIRELEARGAITGLLQSLNIRIDTNRAENEVVDRLLRKIREDEQAPKLRRALDYMRRLSELGGPPKSVLPRARQLFQDFDVDARALETLESILDKLALYGAMDTEIELDLGLSRGLHYYTGLIFEVRCTVDRGDELQLCGGGRYDNLISVLGGNEATPALGFAWGIERIAGVIRAEEGEALLRPQVFVAPIAEDDAPYAIEVARRLRERGWIIELSIDGRNLSRSLRHANRKNAAVVAIVGENERGRERVLLRDMRARRDLEVALDGLEAAVEGMLNDDESSDV